MRGGSLESTSSYRTGFSNAEVILLFILAIWVSDVTLHTPGATALIFLIRIPSGTLKVDTGSPSSGWIEPCSVTDTMTVSGKTINTSV
jgi:hypothetical protein